VNDNQMHASNPSERPLERLADTPPASNLPTEEWYFPKVTNYELHDALDWEYSREIEFVEIEKHVVRVRSALWEESRKSGLNLNCETFDELAAAAYPPSAQFNFDELCADTLEYKFRPNRLLIFSSEWPESPYLQIPKAERLRRIRYLLQTPYLGLNEIARQVLPRCDLQVPIYKFIAAMRKQENHDEWNLVTRDGTAQLSVFRLDWVRNSDEALITDFRRWLKLYRPVKEIRTFPKRKQRSKLDALGAYRLLKIMTPEQVYEYTLLEKDRPLYKSPTDLYRKRDEAEETIRELIQFYFTKD